MSNLKITNGFRELSDAKLLARAQEIKTCMTGNSHFPTPSPGLAEFQTAINEFSDALAVAEQGSQLDKAIKNDKRKTLIQLLHSLGNYVLFTADGDFIAALSSGFGVGKTPSPSPPLVPATNQKVEDGPVPGSVKYSFNRVKGAKGQIYQWAKDPLTESSVWKNKAGTTRKTIITDLESGQKYWFRTLSIGVHGQGVYSEPVSRIIQ